MKCLIKAEQIRIREEDLDEEILATRLPTFLKVLRIGDELFASCSQAVFGTIAAINGNNTVDILVNDINELIVLESDNAYHIHVERQKVWINNIEIKWIHEFDKGDLYAEFDTVNGCGGCVRRFTIRRNGVPISGKVAVLV